ncbi:hemagglutinin repeat-containing protein [Pelorhabdus rhamnosifermentans]|uniref:hemagglutinin repeat-containing protein n=1 Tax=Pelorhabdus rhamnosifermentans TaxID=2772457 RepID=UPI001C062108|nr:hemagglutinin repeat-containing protein [Pelorhabdus rhamnosifermentans]
MNVTGATRATGQNMAAGNLTVKGGAVDLSGSKTYAGSNANLTSVSGDLNTTGAAVQAVGILTAKVQGALHNDQDAKGTAGQIQAGKLTVTADAISNRGGKLVQTGSDNTVIQAIQGIDNTQGQIATNATDVAINGNALNNSQGQIEQAGTGNLNVKLAGDANNNGGKIGTNGELNVQGQNIANSQGQIVAQKGVNLTVQSGLSNRNGLVSGGDKVTITVLGTVDNSQGSIEAGKGLTLGAQSVNNQNGRIVNLDGSDLHVNASQDIQNQSGLMGGNGNVVIASQILSNQGGKVTSQGNLTITATDGIDSNLSSNEVKTTGAIASGKDLTITSGGQVVLTGSTTANGNIAIQATSGLNNQSMLLAGGNTNVATSGELDNSGVLAAGQQTTLTAGNVNSTGTLGAGVKADGSLGTTGNLMVNATGATRAIGQNMAAGNLTVKGGTVDLSGSKTYAGSNASLTSVSGDLNTTGAAVQAVGTLTANVQGALHNDQDAKGTAGQIQADKLIVTADSISNRGGKLVQTGSDNTVIQATQGIDNTQGQIATNAANAAINGNALNNSQGQIVQAGTGMLSVHMAGDVQNSDGKIGTNGQLELKGQNVTNIQGQIVAQKDVTLHMQSGLINQTGLVSGGEAVTVKASGTIDNSQGSIEAGKGLTLGAQSVHNQNGRIVNLDGSDFNVNASQDIQNQSGLLGGNGNVVIASQTLGNQGGKVTSPGNLTITATVGIDSNLSSNEVKTTGAIASGKDLTITSGGQVGLTGSTTANGNITIQATSGLNNQSLLLAGGNTRVATSGELDNSGVLAAGQQTTLTAGSVHSTGTLGAGVKADGSLGATGDLTVNTTGIASANGQNMAAGNLSVTGGTVDLSGSKTYSGSNANLTSVSGDLNTTGAAVQAVGTLTANAQGTLHNDQDMKGTAGQIQAGKFTVTADSISNRGGSLVQTGSDNTVIQATHDIDNTQGQIATNAANVEINGNALNNSQGQIAQAGTGMLSVHMAGDVNNNSGKIGTNGQLELQGQNVTNSQGQIAAQKGLNLTVQSGLSNQHGLVSGGDKVTITAQGTVDNSQGSIEAGKGLTFGAQSVNNQNGRIVNLDGNEMKVTASQDIQNQSGLIGGNGNVVVASQTLSNQGGKITSPGNLTITATDGIDSKLSSHDVQTTGAIASGKDLNITSGGQVVLTGSTTAGGNIDIQATSGLNNQSMLLAGGHTSVTTQGELANSGVLAAGQQTTLTAGTVSSTGTLGAGVKADGSLGTTGDLTINTTDATYATGQNMAAGNLTIQGGTVDLSGSKTYAGSNANLTAVSGGISTAGGVVQVAGTLTAKAQGTFHNEGGAVTSGQIALTIDSISNVSGKLTQLGTEKTKISAVHDIDNTQGQIASNGTDVEINGSALNNSQGQIVQAGTGMLSVHMAGDVNNNSGKIGTNGQLELQGQNVTNSQGQIAAQKGLNLTVESGLSNQHGLVSGGDKVTITAQGTVDNSQGSIEAGKGLMFGAQSVNNQNGRIVNLDSSEMKVTASQDIQNQSGLIGGNGNVVVASQTLSNQGGKITSPGNLTITATEGIDSKLSSHDVQNTGAIASGRDLTITSGGQVVLTGSTTANENIDIQATSGLNNQSMLLAGGNTHVTTQGELDNSGVLAAGQQTTLTAGTVSSTGTLGAGVKADGSLGTTGDLTINTTDATYATGQNMAAGNLTIQGGTVDLSGSKTYAGSNANLTAVSGDISTAGGVVQVAGTLNSNVQGAFHNEGGAVTAGQVALTADSISNVNGKMTQLGTEITKISAVHNIDNTQGQIATNAADAEINGKDLNNSQGQIVQAGTGNLNVKLVGDVNNNGGKIGTNGQLELKGQNVTNNQGQIAAQKGVNLTVQSGLSNHNGLVSSGETVNITAQGTVDNSQGSIEAGKGLMLGAQSVQNQNGRIVNLDGSDLHVTASQDIQNQSGLIGGNGNVVMTSQTLGNQGGKVTSQGNTTITAASGIDNTAGKIFAQQDLAVWQKGADLNNTQGLLGASGNVTVQAADVNNQQGKLVSDHDLTLVAKSLTGLGQTFAGQDLSITLHDDYTQQTGNDVKANGNFKFITAGSLINQGTLEAGGNMSVSANSITNHTGATIAGGSGLTLTTPGQVVNDGQMSGSQVDVHASQLINTNAIMGDHLTVTAGSISNTGASAIIAGTQNIQLYAGNVLENKDGATIYSAGNLVLAGSAKQDGSGNYTDRIGNFLNQSATVEADQNMGIFANQITNRKREFATQQKVVLDEWAPGVSYHCDNVPGEGIHSHLRRGGIRVSPDGEYPPKYLIKQTITDTIITKDSSEGKILAGGNMIVRAGTVDNNMSKIMAAGTLDITAGTIDNTTLAYTRVNNRLLGIQAQWRDHPDNLYDFHDVVYEQPISGYTAILGGGKQVVINAGSVNNIKVAPSDAFQSTPDGLTASVSNGVAYFEKTAQGYNKVAETAALAKQFGVSGGSNVNSIGSAQQTGQLNTKVADGLSSGPTGVSGGLASNGISSTQEMGPTNHRVTDGLIFGHTGVASNQNTDTITQVPMEDTAVKITGVAAENMAALMPTASSAESNIPRQTTNGSGLTLPQNSLFKLHQEPSAQYLVETDSRFTNYKNFISSDYMLQQISSDPSKIQKRLGDGFYEQQLIRDQVGQLTGRYYLDGYSSDQEEYKQLMTNGVVYAKQYHLDVGVALTSEQMATLTSDMVWMVEKEVQGQKVLVPVVYLAHTKDTNLTPSGSIIAADNVTIHTSGDLKNSGTIQAKEGLQVDALDINNYGGKLDGGQGTLLTATQDIANISGSISGQQIQIQAGHDFKNETASFNVETATGTKTTVGNIASVSAGQNLVVQAGHDVSVNGANLKAGGDLSLQAGHNLAIGAVEQNDQSAMSRGKFNFNTSTTKNVTSTLQAAGTINLVAQNDATLRGVQVDAGKDLNLIALSGNTTIAAVKDHTQTEYQTNDSKGREKIYRHTANDDETVIGSGLTAGNNINIGAFGQTNGTGNILVSGSNIISQTGTIQLQGTHNVTIEAVNEHHESLDESRITKKGFLSSKTTETRDYQLNNDVKGSTLSGNAIAIVSGQDLTVKGSNIVGTNDVTLGAKDNINISSAEESSASEHYHYEKKSGIFGGGSFGITIGSRSQKTDNTVLNINQVSSTIGSTNGNVTLQAGKNVDIAASNLISGKDLNIAGQNVTIETADNVTKQKQVYEFKQSGLSFSVGSPALNVIGSAVNNIQRSTEVSDSRLKALYDYRAAETLTKDDTLKNISKNGVKAITSGGSISVSLGTSQTRSETNSEIVTAQSSQLTAGQNLNIAAFGGDITIKGSQLDGKNINLTAAKDVNLEAAQNTTHNQTTTSGSSSGIGVDISAKGAGAFVQGSKNKGNENGDTITHVDTKITAGDTLTIHSGQDVNLAGAKTQGETIKIDAGRDLNLKSLQDSDNYHETNSSVGGKMGIGTGIDLSAGKGKINSNYNSVTEQTGIYAGKGGFDIQVGMNTDLKGAVIASDATPDKNKLSTDTLTHSDIQNKADYSASSSGYNLDTVTNIKDGGKDVNGKQVLVAEKGLSGSPDISVPVNGSASSTTKSAIAQGTIIVRSGNTDLSSLNRNTTDSLNALGKIFDKKKVQEQQELTKVFGQEAYKAIGDLALNQYQKALDDADKAQKAGNTTAYKEAMARADSWHDGGANKILLHAVAGGIMSDLGGSSFTSGAASAGLNEAVQNELAKIKDPGIHQLVSAAIGAVASKLAGGNAQAGASIAVNATKYNWLDHYQQQAMAEALKAAGDDSGKRLEIYSFYAALSQYNEDHYLTRDEAIEQSLLDQLHYDTADTKGGLNLTLNQITGYYQGYDLAGYYRGMLEGNKDYLPSFLDHFDYSQGQRQDMQDNYKPAPAPAPETVDSVMNNGGSWNSDGQAVRSDGKVCDNLPSRGEYEYSKTGRIDDYYPDGTAAINIDGKSYPIDSAPKKTVSDETTTQSTTGQNTSEPKSEQDSMAVYFAKGSLKAQGFDPNDPTNAKLLAAEVEKQIQVSKEVNDSVMGSIGGGGFKTFKELKAFLGSPGEGNQWHHIVEQAQQNACRAGFAAEEINTVENIIALQSGKGSVHSEISGFYSSKPDFTHGLTVRDWLASQSFEEQFKFGMNYLRKFGDVVKENGSWVFKPFE